MFFPPALHYEGRIFFGSADDGFYLSVCHVVPDQARSTCVGSGSYDNQLRSLSRNEFSENLLGLRDGAVDFSTDDADRFIGNPSLTST